MLNLEQMTNKCFLDLTLDLVPFTAFIQDTLSLDLDLVKSKRKSKEELRNRSMHFTFRSR